MAGHTSPARCRGNGWRSAASVRYARLFQRLDVEYVDVVFHQDLGQLATPDDQVEHQGGSP